MHDLDRADRRRLLRLRWPEMPDEQFEALCEVWDGNRIGSDGKFRGPKIPREKKSELEFPTACVSNFLNPRFDPGAI